jgi:hypothetical protein
MVLLSFSKIDDYFAWDFTWEYDIPKKKSSGKYILMNSSLWDDLNEFFENVRNHFI